jgi:hypothetical protein
MGIFSRILDKLRGHGPTSGPNSGNVTSGSSTTAQQQQFQPPGQSGQAGQQAVLSNVDVEAVLAQMASKKGGGGNYRTSIVDLLKLLDLDSDLNARKELAQELNVNAGAHGSAEQNIALQKAVMRKLAENGGRVPDSLRD